MTNCGPFATTFFQATLTCSGKLALGFLQTEQRIEGSRFTSTPHWRESDQHTSTIRWEFKR
jgi:hypothetical protein